MDFQVFPLPFTPKFIMYVPPSDGTDMSVISAVISPMVFASRMSSDEHAYKPPDMSIMANRMLHFMVGI